MTGLIYVAIIGLWAAVLLPMWLRRHDDAQARVRLDRHGSAMGALAHSRNDEELHGEAVLRRRRRAVVLALSGLAVLVLMAWGLGFARGWMALLAVVPVLVYGGSMVVSRRVQARDASRRAKERSRASRAARHGAHAQRRASTDIHPQRSARQVREPSRSVSVVRPSPANAAASSTRPSTRQSARVGDQVARTPYDRIFDQTA